MSDISKANLSDNFSSILNTIFLCKKLNVGEEDRGCGLGVEEALGVGAGP